MSKLRVLLVEDNDDDALLLIDALREGGYTPEAQRVETEVAYRAALDEASWDIIIADYVLPRFSGIAAIRIARERGWDIPIIMVSGKAGENRRGGYARGRTGLPTKRKLGPFRAGGAA